MQNAKDTFYVTLQSRLATLNPARTIVVRGVVRPGTLVVENELPSSGVPVDAFRLQWTGLQVNRTGALPLVTMECSIQYATDGSTGNAGMDRGRLLAAMDAELAAALGAEPHTVPKINYSASGTGVSPTTMGTNVFWADPIFGTARAIDERLERTTTVQVFAYQEAGEL
ncbi:MAG: hypothetical protein P4K80_08565 [Acidobacteriaceae bacterium]|nr:hypothetical protein [Acidobacteriaceae bacterium]